MGTVGVLDRWVNPSQAQTNTATHPGAPVGRFTIFIARIERETYISRKGPQLTRLVLCQRKGGGVIIINEMCGVLHIYCSVKGIHTSSLA